MLEAIEEGQEDDRIKAIVLRLDSLVGTSMSMLEEIGAALDEFRDSGKPVYAYGRGYTQAQYYIAAHADEILLDSSSFPTLGGVFMTGFGAYPTYFSSALEKLNVNIHLFKVGSYKSAAEPYTRNSMSEEAKASTGQWLGELWSAYSQDVISNREITEQAFTAYTNRYDELLANADGDSVQLAVDQGLVDRLVTHDEFESELADQVGKNGNGEFARIGFRDYLKVIRPPIPVPTPGADQIAVITVKGTILDGEQPAGTIGGETVSKLVEKARKNDAVKAVVLRIDSPGGSANASERIRAQLAMTQRAGKPVVVSMSGVAASGGYWIASTANKIFALPTTITGSIGAYIVLPSLENSLAELGITTDGIGTTDLSGSLDLTQPLNPVLERTLQISIQQVYRRFLNVVAEGREMTVNEVDEIAQGRVWSGQTAVEIGLVDAIGNLDDAIQSAALLADATDYEILHIEKELSAREQLIRQLLNSSAAIAKAAFGDSTLRDPGPEITVQRDARAPRNEPYARRLSALHGLQSRLLVPATG
ncbi:MAG: signal peptide peptidase SppA [Gammaproteobacteria bacterium]|nr:signal peptide peptidase SppA [Gammaproteobacteria bacterium]